MITLGGVQLYNPNAEAGSSLVMQGEFEFSGVRAVVEYAKAGNPLIWEGLFGGRPIDLVGDTNAGWLLRSTLLQLKTMAAVPGATYTLDYNGTISTVRFRQEDQPVISGEMITPVQNPDSDDAYNNIRIKLMEV